MLVDQTARTAFARLVGHAEKQKLSTASRQRVWAIVQDVLEVFSIQGRGLLSTKLSGTGGTGRGGSEGSVWGAPSTREVCFASTRARGQEVVDCMKVRQRRHCTYSVM